MSGNKDISKVKAGQEAEEHASKFLANLGYRLVKRNFKYGNVGEIDIIAFDGDTLVFVEVKCRTNYTYGTPEEAVDPRKQAQIKKVASMYYYVNNITDQVCRFDVIAVDMLFGKTEIRHHISAFF